MSDQLLNAITARWEASSSGVPGDYLSALGYARSDVAALLEEVARLRAELTEPWGPPKEKNPRLLESVRMARVWYDELARLDSAEARSRREHIGTLLQVIDGLRATHQRLEASVVFWREADRQSGARIRELEIWVADLEKDSAKLRALEVFGVDNWEEYDEAMQSLG